MPEVTISINSRPFQILCEKGEEDQLGVLADDLAARVTGLKESADKVGDSHLLVLAGLMLVNELHDARREIVATKQDVEKANATRKDLNDRINELENTVADALNKASAGVEKLLEDGGTDNAPPDMPNVPPQ